MTTPTRTKQEWRNPATWTMFRRTTVTAMACMTALLLFSGASLGDTLTMLISMGVILAVPYWILVKPYRIGKRASAAVRKTASTYHQAIVEGLQEGAAQGEQAHGVPPLRVDLPLNGRTAEGH